MTKQYVGRKPADPGSVGPLRRMLLLAAAALSLLHAGRGGAAVLEPAVTVTVDGVAYSVPLRAVSKAAGAGSMSIYVVDNYSVTVQDQYSFTISSARLDPDPSIAYALSVTDFGAASTFSFLFGTPIVSTGSPNLVSAGLAGTLTDGGIDGVTITPTGPKIQASGVGFPLTDMGVGVDLGESVGPLAGPVGTWTWLQVTSAFSLTGGGDQAALTGFASIVEGQLPPSGVPEPGSLALLGIALAATAAARRRKNAA